MHKKYTILAAVFLLFSSAFIWSLDIWSSISREESKRREFLYSLDRKDKLNRVHYREYGDKQLTVLGKDIVIIKKTCKKILARKNNAEGVFFFYIIPGCLRIMQIKSIFRLMCAGICLAHACSMVYRDYEGSEEFIFIALMSTPLLIEIIKFKVCSYIFNYYIRKNDEFIEEQQDKLIFGHNIVLQLEKIKKEVIQSS